MSHQTDTFLSIKDAEVYVCAIYKYELSHYQMYIKIEHPVDAIPRYINFSYVHYFSGTTTWQNANFRIGTSIETLKFLRELDEFNKLKDDTLLELFKLYTIDSFRPGIKLIASASHVIDELPSYIR